MGLDLWPKRTNMHVHVATAVKVPEGLDRRAGAPAHGGAVRRHDLRQSVQQPIHGKLVRIGHMGGTCSPCTRRAPGSPWGSFTDLGVKMGSAQASK